MFITQTPLSHQFKVSGNHLKHFDLLQFPDPDISEGYGIPVLL